MFTKKNKRRKIVMMFALLGMILPCILGLSTKNVQASERKCNYPGNSLTVVAKTEAATDATTEGGSGGGLNDFDVTLDEDGNLVTSFDKQGDSQATWKTLYAKYKGVIVGVAGLLTLTFVVWFLMCFGKIAANATNPQGRKEAITGCVFTAIAAAACGIVTVIAALAWNAFR